MDALIGRLAACVVAVALLCVSAGARAATVIVGPYVQDVEPDGFVVAYETDVPADGVVRAGGAEVATHGTRHEARLARLSPATRYRYRVTVDGVDTGGGEAATAPGLTEDRPLNFVVYGDTRDGGEAERQVVRAALAAQPELALHTGDLVRVGTDALSWRAFFAAEATLLAEVPLYPAVGNHELYRDPAGEHFARYFVLPEDGRTRRYYTFRWGAVQFIALDGNGHFDEQTAWLKGTLARAEPSGVRHVFVFLHQPPFSTGGHCGSAIAEREWVALFERYHVRAVFGGHDHLYERLERGGVRYFVTGGGGAEVYPERPDCPRFDGAARRVFAAAHHFLRVRVVGDQVEVAAVATDGPPIETVRFSRAPAAVAGLEPPLTDERLLGNLPVGGCGASRPSACRARRPRPSCVPFRRPAPPRARERGGRA
jgi:hypothetical protein